MGVFREHAAVAAGQDHRQAGVSLANHGGELDAVHSGHDDVGEYQIEGQFVGREQRKRFSGVGDPLDRVAQILEQFGRELPDFFVVLDHQDVMATAAHGRFRADDGGFLYAVGRASRPAGQDKW